MSHHEPAHQGFETLAIHAGQDPDPTTGAVIPPVHMSSTYVQDGIGGLRGGYEYGRAGNPTRAALETQLAALEGGAHGLSFASGLAAEDALLRAALKPGDDVLIGDDVYGGTYRLVSRGPRRVGRAAPRRGPARIPPPCAPRSTSARRSSSGSRRRATRTADHRHRRARRARRTRRRAARRRQHLRDAGAAAPARARRRRGRALDDEVPGRALRRRRRRAVLPNDDALAEQVKFLQFAAGAVSGPLDAWLTTRGIKTLRRADGAPRRERARGRPAARGTPRGGRACTTRACPGTRVMRSRPARRAGSAAW